MKKINPASGNDLAESADGMLQRVLRISPEPCTQFNDVDVHRLLTRDPAAYFNYVRDALGDIAHARAELELPAKQLFQDPGRSGDFRVMPCVFRRDGEVIKTVKLVGTNLVQEQVPDQITVGKACLLHPQENFVSHLFDACVLSSARTGLCAAQAVDLLARDTRRIVIVGAGRVGYYAAYYCASVLGAEQVTIMDVDQLQAQAACQLLTREVKGTEFSSVPLVEGDAADVAILATSSKTPVYHPDSLPAALVVSLGADADDQRELHTDCVNRSALFVDTLDSARYGDLRAWLEQGLIERGDLTDLFTVLKAPQALDQDGQRVFVSTGSALFDNLTIAYLVSDG